MATSTPVTVIVKKHQVGSFTFDSTYFEQHTAEIDITDQPVELGANIQDHAFATPLMLTVSGGVSDTPLLPNPSFDATSTAARSANAYQQLLILMNNRQLISVQTGLAGYSNMLIKNITTMQNAATANIFDFVMTLQQILIIGVQNVNVPSQFLQTGKVSDLASPEQKNGNQLPKQPKPQQVSIWQGWINKANSSSSGN